MDTPATRLRAAREAAGFTSAREASIALDLAYETYAQHENGTRGFKNQSAERYARRFRTSVEWLLFGKNEVVRTSDTAIKLMVPVVLPSGDDMAQMFEGLLDAVGRRDLAVELAPQLAELLPAALSRVLNR